MKIGIIGSGNVGGTLVRRFTTAGHDVVVANSRGPGSLTALAEETGATAGSVEQAARETDMVVLALPLAEVASLPADAFNGRLVVDADNYFGGVSEIDATGETSSRWTANHLPGAVVVKAFNSVYAEDMATGATTPDGGVIALPVAADDALAKQKVMAMLAGLGFDPVDAGGLDDSWRQQPGTPASGHAMDADHLRAGLSAAG
jgi:8-hydroxy-5-deazaflavin:NADPH oxidoreductase